VVVKGIPLGWTEENVELFFDDDRYCPRGRVEKVELAVGKGKTLATVTFEDPQGSFRIMSYHSE